MFDFIIKIINLAPFAIGVAVGFFFKPEIQIAITAIKATLKAMQII